MKNIKVLDIFSYVKASELSLKEIEDCFLNEIHNYKNLSIVFYYPKEKCKECHKQCIDELSSEGKEIGYMVDEDNNIMVIVAYQFR